MEWGGGLWVIVGKVIIFDMDTVSGRNFTYMIIQFVEKLFGYFFQLESLP